MNYEQLTNTHFIKYPSHPKWLHEIFRPFWVSMFLAAAFCTHSSFFELEEDWLFLWLSFFCAIMPILKIAFAQNFLLGHGVGLIKKSRFSLLGLPNWMTIIQIVLILGTGWAALKLNYGEIKEENFNLKAILILKLLFSYLFISFLASLLSWRFHTYYETWYGSECDAKSEFENKGFSKEEIEKKINLLKKKGIIS